MMLLIFILPSGVADDNPTFTPFWEIGKLRLPSRYPWNKYFSD